MLKSLVSMLHYLLGSLLSLLKLQMEVVHCVWGSQRCAPAAGLGSAQHLQKEGNEEKNYPAAQTALSPQPEGVFGPPSHPVQQGQSLGCSPEG